LNLQPDGAVIILFGATGDLARRKLFPAFYSLYREGKLSDKFAVIGVARRSRTNEQFQNDVLESIREFARHQPEEEEEWKAFAAHFRYLPLDIHDMNAFRSLQTLADDLDNRFAIGGNRLFYLALAPELFGSVSHHLKDGGLLDSPGWHRLVIEKPFGYDLASAEKLNEEIRHVFPEENIFRIDHYLGKEMVQNIEVIRFTNAFFEPIWNNRYISNIQITLSETVGVEERGGYYDTAGALRDMGQNHMLQMVTMMAMEPPGVLHPEAVRDEKVKVLKSLRLYKDAEDVRRNVVRGQYAAGEAKGKAVPGYLEEDKVPPDSKTETYFAAKIFVDNFRWAGVPFYVRTGKRLPAKATEVVVEFKNVPDNVYLASKHTLQSNLLVFRVNPMEGVYIKFNAKAPGSEEIIMPVAMDFCQSNGVGINTPEAYERLLNDAIRGDSTYFTRWDEVASAWRFVDRIASAWNEVNGDLERYPAGSWGPAGSMKLLEEDGHQWWPVNGQRDDSNSMRICSDSAATR
jgi:glucose-6-phosphate 1-dehydrogenase